MNALTTGTRPKRVTWTSDDDLQCAILAGMGFSTKMIMACTHLTICQISYRLKKGGIYRRDYRDGTSDVAHRMLGAVPKSKQSIRNLLKLEVIK
jgi:hypothetical protein